MLLADGWIQPNNYLEEFHHHKRFILCMFHHSHLHPPPPPHQHHKRTVLLFSFFGVSLIELANQEYPSSLTLTSSSSGFFSVSVTVQGEGAL